ncbi:MAG: NADPH-dependent F420 reductase [Planctomycetota bacterium]
MQVQKIGVLGSGVVGRTLADGFLKHGFAVMRGSRDPAKLAEWKEQAGAAAQIGTFAETGAFGDAIVLAVKGTAAEAAVRAAGVDALRGKTVLDATNPIADQPPEHGVLRYFTGPDQSLMERLQQIAPGAHFVKAFSSVGSALMVDPKLPGGPPTMFVCGDDTGAKRWTTEVLARFGWETADMGPAVAARAIEPLAMLWCIPGFAHGRWSHAFKLLQA